MTESSGKMLVADWSKRWFENRREKPQLHQSVKAAFEEITQNQLIYSNLWRNYGANVL